MSEKNVRRLTITDIETKQFHRVSPGYEQREVDEFLDSICDEMERMQAEIMELQRSLELANAETRKAEASKGYVAPAPVAPANTVPDDSFREILEMAHRVKEMTIADAQKKAEEIVAEAHAAAEAELGNLEEKRADLQNEVEKLHQQGRAYHSTLTELIRTQQEALALFNLDGE